MDILIGPYDYTNDIRVNLCYHVMLLLLHDTLENPGCIGIPRSHHHAHYTIALVTGFVLLSR